MSLEVPQVVVTVSAADMRVNFKGTYSSEETYQPGAYVASEKALWVCTTETTGQTPAEGSGYWTLLGVYGE